MLNIDLNIKTIDNKFVITVDKTEITPEYLIELLNWLQLQSTIYSKKYFQTVSSIKNEGQFNSPKIIRKQSKKKREWKYSGSVNLNNQFDNINLRDFAYE